MKRHITLFSVLIACFVYSFNALAHKSTYPEVIPVPNGFQPEGVVRGRGHNTYVGSLLNGAIYEVDLISGKGEILVPGQDDKMAVGLAYDKRTNYIYVAGGLKGTVSVYDAENGELVGLYQVTEATGNSFVNDGIVTPNGAYFTDSFQSNIYVIPLNYHGNLPDTDQVKTLKLTGDFVLEPGQFNANGIVANKKGNQLYVVNSYFANLFSVDPETGVATEVPISGGDLANGDGMVLKEKTLYVVQNFLNQIAVVELNDKGTKGRITEYITHPEFRIPTTATAFGEKLYVINARFDVAPPPVPGNPPADSSLEYKLIRVDIDD